MEETSRKAFAWPVLVPAAFFVGMLFFWMQTGDVMILVFGSIVLVNAWCAWWVWNDAPKRGMDRVPWALVAAIVEPLGIVAYLVVRELKGRRA